MLTHREQMELENIKHKLTTRQLTDEEVKRWEELEPTQRYDEEERC